MKRSVRKRFIALSLAFVMALGVCPAALAAEGEPEESAFTPVEASDVRVAGAYNDDTALKLELAGRYNSGAMNEDGGSLEIVQYNKVNGFAYAVSGVKGKLIAVDLNGALDGETVADLPGVEYDLKELVQIEGFTYGDMTSVAVSPDGGKLAAALQDEDYAKPGLVALFSCGADGALTLRSTVCVGVQPDMVAFADNSTILTADEGEPREGAGQADPKGSVSIVTVGAEDSLTAETVTFDAFDEKRDALTAAGVLVQKETQPSTDFEPEYIAVSGGVAYVSLQEANAVAVLDIRSKTFTGVYPLGFQDYGVTKVDLEKNDVIELKNYENVCGVKLPDGISVAEFGGKTYLLTANEGDSRADWPGLDNEAEGKSSPTGNITLDEKVVWFDPANWDGLDSEKAYVFGGRSFSIYEVEPGGLRLVYDSGSDFETVTAELLPDNFNCSNDKISLDNRSGKKGPEPESVTVGAVGDRTYAFIALERVGGVMVYDVTDPANAQFVNYINSRDFGDKIKGDVSPEGLCFVPADDSKTGAPLLLAACEVSGTLAAYTLTAQAPQPELEGLKVAVISDDHLYDAAALGSEGTAFERYLASDRKLLAESEVILDAALEKIKASGAEYLLIPGDLTKDGERINHELLAEKLAALEAESDIEVFVINGNHDISNAHAVRFEGETTTPVETVDANDFRDIYKDFGYGQAVAKDVSSLSYAVDLGTDYRLIVMDACIYNNDKESPSQDTGGAFSSDTLDWVLAQIKSAVRADRRPVGMMHHGLVPHTAIQPAMFSEYLVKDYGTVAATLADAGMNLVFTGHFHSQDVTGVTTQKGNVLYDVETGSLVTSPCPIRFVTLGTDSFGYTTDHVTEVAGIEDFSAHAANFLQEGMTGLVNAMLPAALKALGVTDEAQIAALCQNEALKALLVGGFVAHYAGDEKIDQTVSAGAAQLAQFSQDLANVVLSLYTDAAPADSEAAALELSPLPDYPSAGVTSGRRPSSSTTTTTTKNPDGSTTTTVTNTATGTVTETTTFPGGGKTVVETAKDGAVTTTQTAANGVKTVTQRSADGAVTAAVTLPAGVKTAAVTIPTGETPTQSTVAVLVKADGTEEIVKTSVPTESGVTLTLTGDASVKIVDNAKDFADVAGDSWAAGSVAFVAAREIMTGTGEGAFSPAATTTRAMLMTMLARLDGADTAGGKTWFEKGMTWAVDKGVSDGSDPEGTITREQLAAMLYRYAGEPETMGKLDGFADADTVSDWAEVALRWCVEKGVVTGKGGKALDPQGNATRAEVAAMLERFIKLAAG